MWHNIQEDPPYLLLSRQFNNMYAVYVTDLVSVWFVNFKKKEFLECLKVSNFGLEVSEEELLKKGCNMLNNPTDIRKLDVKKGVSSLELSMSKLFEYPLQLKLKLAEGSKEMFFREVTLILLKTATDLIVSQRDLRNLLQKKDEEIEEYKCEGKEIALRYLKTKKFDDEEHMKQHHLVQKESADLLNIPMTVLEKIVATTDRNESIERENMEDMKIKQELATPTESLSELCLTANLKREVKVEPHNSVSPRKKRKQKLNY